MCPFFNQRALDNIDAVNQAQLLLRDMKIAQCELPFFPPPNLYKFFFILFSDVKLPPRAAFTAQVIGTLFGSLLNFGNYISGRDDNFFLKKNAFFQ